MFVHLRCHSQYSFLRAVPAPEELVRAAAEQGMPAVALTDTDGLYAAVPFYQAAREAGVKPIVGAELEIETRNATLDTRPSIPHSETTGLSATVVLLAADAAGYSNLCQLVTARQLGEQPLPLETLAQHSAGLIALCKPEQGEARNSKFETRESRNASGSGHCQRVTGDSLATLKDIFGDRLYLALERLRPGDGRAVHETLRLARTMALLSVATNNVHFLRPEEHLQHRVLNAIRTGGLLSTVAPPEITSPEAYFKSAAEMQRAFADCPEALRTTLEIADRVNLELELGKLIFPEFPTPPGETPFSYLRKLCLEGARQRYRPLRPEVLARLTHELEVIHKLNLAPYFLLVWDIAEEARRRGIPAVARGSAASSMVTYCLGISRVCPLRWGLYFERFLNEQRGDCPDIDLDICGARRDELLDYVYRRWGGDPDGATDRPGHPAAQSPAASNRAGLTGLQTAGRVAMVASFVTMHARLAVREVAKVFGVPPGEVNHFTRRLPHRPVREILEAIRTLPECRALPAQQEPWKTILEVALRLDGFPRHLGIHPCGTVIAAQPLAQRVPLERATKGIIVTQYDMNAIEALGLIKMDLLGQRGLTTMSLALENIRATTGEDIRIDELPEHDPETCALLATGRTMGVFQIESPGMRSLLRTLRARTMEDLSLALALIRPGASEYGAKETFLKRLRKQEPVRYAHPRLEPILAETLGVCVYQEQVMQIAQAVGGMSLAEADLVRRSSAKFADQRERQRLRAKFLKAAARLGITDERLEQTWRMVEKFAGFGFCKAHAATYADLAYRMAWLKAHYPAEFLAAMCSASAGFYHVSAYVEEAKRWGIPVRLPSVNHSRLEYTVEPGARVLRRGTFPGTIPAAEEAGSRAIRIGLMQVKGLRLETIATIFREREQRGAFRSLEDFLTRVPAERDELETLIKCGAFDEACAGKTRPTLLWELNLLLRKRPVPAGNGPLLFADAAPAEPPSGPAGFAPAADHSREQRLAYEQALLEVCVSGHPLDLVTRNGEVWSSELAEHRGRRVTLLGVTIAYRHVPTKNYRNMMFVTLEDQRGTFEVVLFPDAYQRCGGVVFESRLLRVTGRVEPDGNINGEKIEAVIRG